MTEDTSTPAATPATEETMPPEETTMLFQCRRRPANELGTGAVSPDNTDEKQRGRPFEKGTSGNPSGRPRGSRNATTLALEALLDGQAEALTRKAIDLALTGDLAALRLCMDRILPARRDRPVLFALPQLTCAADAVKASAAIVEAVAVGDLTPIEAAELSRVVDGFTRAVEAADLDARLTKLEQAK